MSKTPVGQMVARCAVAVGIILSLMLAAGAPSDGSTFGKSSTTTTQSK